MRCLARQRRSVWIGRYMGLVQGKDEHGRLTGQPMPQYKMPREFKPTVSAARGEASADMFGSSIDYDRTVIIDDPKFEASESDVLWVESDVERDPHDYIIRRISRTGGYTVMAIKRVQVSQ